MDPMTLMLISSLGGAAIGGLKSELVDKPEFERQEKLRAQDVRYSPWVNMRTQTDNKPTALGGALGGAGYGMAIGQSLGKSGLVKPDVPTTTPAVPAASKIDLGADQMAYMSPSEKSKWLLLSEQMNASPQARSYWESVRA